MKNRYTCGLDPVNAYRVSGGAFCIFDHHKKQIKVLTQKKWKIKLWLIWAILRGWIIEIER